MGFVKDTFNAITGKTAADAAGQGAAIQAASVTEGIAERRRAGEQGLGFLEPFGQLGASGLEQASFLTDPNEQFAFLKNNPLFQLSLENANTQTKNLAASRSRLSAGDTLQQLTNNALISASPLIAQQKQSIGDLLNFGSGIATAQANTAIGTGSDITNLITDRGAVEAGGVIGAANARTQATQGLLGLGGTLGAASILRPSALATSDRRFKARLKIIGMFKGFKIYEWDWNALAESFGLRGRSYGVVAQDIIKTRPDAVVIDDDGYYKVNYELLGVPHGN